VAAIYLNSSATPYQRRFHSTLRGTGNPLKFHMLFRRRAKPFPALGFKAEPGSGDAYMSQAITFRRLARAALNTAATADDSTASMLRLMTADYAAEADRLEALENADTTPPPHIDVLAPPPQGSRPE
jgi:hypothetical protein